MSWESVLDSDALLGLAGVVASLVWSLWKASEWRRRVADDRVDAAEDVVESAVRDVYETYVRGIKAARDNGKLSAGERKHARKLALEAALRLGETRGVDVVRAAGPGLLDLWIERTVERLKR